MPLFFLVVEGAPTLFFGLIDFLRFFLRPLRIFMPGDELGVLFFFDDVCLLAGVLVVVGSTSVSLSSESSSILSLFSSSELPSLISLSEDEELSSSSSDDSSISSAALRFLAGVDFAIVCY